MKETNTKNCINEIITVPSDKSISHRSIIFEALAKGTTVINNILLSKDYIFTINCFKSTDIKIYTKNNKTFTVGDGLKSLKNPKKVLNVGNSGATIILICDILVNQNFFCEITDDSSILKRPMNRIIEPLTQMNTNIKSKENLGFSPLLINPSNIIKAINYKMKVASAQVKSCIILASLILRR